MDKFPRVLTVLICIFSVAISSFLFQCSPSSKKDKRYRQTTKIYHLHDGRFCYQDRHTDQWFWLILSSDHSSPNFYKSDVQGYTRPNGYSWVNLLIAPEETEITLIDTQDYALAFEQEIIVDSRGIPIVDADGNLVDPDQLNPDEGYDSPSDQAPDGTNDGSDSSGGDTGGGSDGGSDGGGGGD